MTPNEKIVQSAYRLLRGELPNEPAEPGMCLAMVRVVIEDAFYGGKRHWYDRHRSHIVERSPGSDGDAWSRDMERSLTRQGMALTLPSITAGPDPGRYVDVQAALPLLLPGDLIWRWDTAKNRNGDYVGHTAIILPGGLVLENVKTRAGALQRGPTTLSRLGAWPVTTVIRFQPS